MAPWIFAALLATTFGCVADPSGGGVDDAEARDGERLDAHMPDARGPNPDGAGGFGGAGGDGGGGQGGAGGDRPDSGPGADEGPGDAAPPACEEGAEQTRGCESGGEQTRRCENGVYTDFGPCIGGACEPGAEQSRACGFNGRGSELRTCPPEGVWSAYGQCDDPDRCVDGSSEARACGVGAAGSQSRRCEAGQWGAFSPCDEAAACVPGAVRLAPCGLNGGGILEIFCNENGEFGDAPPCVDPDECETGAVEQEACGAGDAGLRSRRCAQGRWTGFGACEGIGGPCEAGTSEALPCGFNRNGRQRRTCDGGQWAAFGACEDADVCVNGAVLRDACGLNGAGSSVQICAGGQWGPVSICDDRDACVVGESERRACGFNGAGTERRACLAGQWAPYAPCDDPDECTTGTSEPAPAGCGFNARGTRTRACVAGRWGQYAACVDPDMCRDAAVETRACGAMGAGQQTRTCAAGRWPAYGRCSVAPLCPDRENPECGPPQPEVCNGLDDDQDGQVDEGLGQPGVGEGASSFDDAVEEALERGFDHVRVLADVPPNGAFGQASGLAALVFLERRSNGGHGPVLGFQGLSAADRARVLALLRTDLNLQAATLGPPNSPAFSYTMGITAMALSALIRTGGPERLETTLGDLTLDELLARVVAALEATQGSQAPNNLGGWNYNAPTAQHDLSTTHFAFNGLLAASQNLQALSPALVATEGVLQANQAPDGGYSYFAGQNNSSTSMTGVGLFVAGALGLDVEDTRRAAALEWLATHHRADAMVGGTFVPTSTYYAFWTTFKALAVSDALHDPRFGVRDPVVTAWPDAPRGLWFDHAVTLLNWQTIGGQIGAGQNGAPAGWTPRSDHLFAMLLLERSLGGVALNLRALGGAPQCDDDIDNDGDGRIDLGDDPECFFACTPVEGPVAACRNFIDDDGDGLIDFPEDPGCASRNAETESPQCDNGVDDDGDGLVDFGDDPSCLTPNAACELAPTAEVCGGLCHDLQTDAQHCSACDMACPAGGWCIAARCFDAATANQCANRIDDDGDGLIDFPADPGCASPDGDLESELCLPERMVTLVDAAPVSGTVAYGADPVSESACGNVPAGQQVYRYALDSPADLHFSATSETPGVRLAMSVRRGCETVETQVGCVVALPGTSAEVEVPAAGVGEYFVRVAPSLVGGVVSRGQAIALVDPRGFVGQDDIQAGCGWGDGGNDAFDCFGTFTLNFAGTPSIPDITVGQRQAAAGAYAYRLTSDKPHPNVWRVRFDPELAGDDRLVNIQVTGNLGSDGGTRSSRGTAVLDDVSLPFFRTDDGNQFDPPVVYLMVPNDPLQLASVRYENTQDNVTITSGPVTLPLTFYVAISYAAEAAVVAALLTDLQVLAAPVAPGALVDFNLQITATPRP